MSGIDEGGRPEGRLLAHPPSYLRRAWSNHNWTVWTVVGSQPIASGPASIIRLHPASFDITFRHAGNSLVRIRASTLWHVTAGAGCVEPGPHGWLQVHAMAAEILTLRARLNMHLLTGPTDCGD